MVAIRVHAVEFQTPAFRKLGGLRLEFANRITVIAGHNGIGKSTIMALVANGSGLPRSSPHKTLSGTAFHANLFDITYIDYETEYRLPKESGQQLPEPTIEYMINDSEIATKTASLTGRAKFKRIRVVARNKPLQAWKSKDNSVSIGRDAKVGLPTLYLGVSRMFPVGEAVPSWVKSQHDTQILAEESVFISEFINDVIVGAKTTATKITTVNVRGIKKFAKHPEYNFDARSISLGQDSLGTIATALASFQKLKREMGSNYPGGLLVIDELDAGLHPHAQGKLITKLKHTAKKLNLQIIATTHSSHVIEAIHPDGYGDNLSPDKVIYLTDIGAPRLASNYSLGDILSDMKLEPKPAAKRTKPRIKIYLEDDEAKNFLVRAVTSARIKQLESGLQIKFNILPLSVGGSNLIGLPKRDPDFNKVIIAVDADTSIPKASHGHILKLPSNVSANQQGLSPDRSILEFAIDLVDNRTAHAATWQKLIEYKITESSLREHIIKSQKLTATRDSMKSWWTSTKTQINRMKLIELWSNENVTTVDGFIGELRKHALEILGTK